jgi:hypothetical protein
VRRRPSSPYAIRRRDRARSAASTAVWGDHQRSDGPGLSGEVHDYGLDSGGDFINEGIGALVARVIDDPGHRQREDLVDVTGAQEDGVCGVEGLWGLVLPEPVEVVLPGR